MWINSFLTTVYTFRVTFTGFLPNMQEAIYSQIRHSETCMHFVSWRLITCWVSSYVSPSGSSIASPWPSMASCPYSSGCRDREREKRSAVTEAKTHICSYLTLQRKTGITVIIIFSLSSTNLKKDLTPVCAFHALSLHLRISGKASTY